MNFRITPIFLAALCLSLAVSSCKSSGKPTADNTRRAVDPALTTPVPFRDFEVDADKDDTLKLEEGTNIFIPGGTFVDASGAAIKGKVQMHYRAFYTPGEIMASGITMKYDTASKTQVFTSAGMFELTGTQNGKPISIAPGKNIAMDFASTRNDATYSFYRLDTATANWNFLSATKADTNKLRKQILKEIAALFTEKPVEPKAFNSKQPVIDIDVDQRDHPELSGYNGIVWQYAGIGPDPEQNDWIYSTDWTSAKLVRNDNTTCTYDLNLSNAKKTFSTKVNPTFKGSDFSLALAKFKAKMEKFMSSEKIRTAKQEIVQRIPIYNRPVAISRLGIHNCDAFRRYGNPQYADAEFHFEDPQFENNRKDVTVYLISANGGTSVGYNALSIQNIIYIPESTNCLIAVLKGTKKAAVLSDSEFVKTMKNDSSGTPKFKLTPTTQEVSCAADIDTLLKTL